MQNSVNGIKAVREIIGLDCPVIRHTAFHSGYGGVGLAKSA